MAIHSVFFLFWTIVCRWPKGRGREEKRGYDLSMDARILEDKNEDVSCRKEEDWMERGGEEAVMITQ